MSERPQAVPIEQFNLLATHLTQLAVEHASLATLGESGALFAQAEAQRHVLEMGKLLRELQAVVMRLPVSISIFEAIIACIGDERYLLRLDHVAETVRPAEADLVQEGGVEGLILRGERLPVIRLADLLARPAPPRATRDSVALVIHREGGKSGLALLVDDVFDTQQILLKPLGSDLKDLPGIAGGAVLGDGTAALVLDLAQLLEAA